MTNVFVWYLQDFHVPFHSVKIKKRCTKDRICWIYAHHCQCLYKKVCADVRRLWGLPKWKRSELDNWELDAAHCFEPGYINSQSGHSRMWRKTGLSEVCWLHLNAIHFPVFIETQCGERFHIWMFFLFPVRWRTNKLPDMQLPKDTSSRQSDIHCGMLCVAQKMRFWWTNIIENESCDASGDCNKHIMPVGGWRFPGLAYLCIFRNFPANNMFLVNTFLLLYDQENLSAWLWPANKAQMQFHLQ